MESALGMRAKLYHVARTILWNDQDAADAMQEAMLKGWKQRHTLRDEAQFEAWFMRILVNQCRDLQRRRMREKGLMAEILSRERTKAPARTAGDALEALRTLPESLRLPALLYYYDGYSQKDIAAILGLTAEQVKTRVRQARAKLKKLLTEGGDDLG